MNQQRGQPHRRFIQKNQLGTGHEGTADHGHLLLTAADKPRGFAAFFLQARKIVIDHLQAVFNGPTMLLHMGPHFQVLFDGEMLEYAAAFNHLHNTHFGNLFRTHPVDAVSAEFNRPIGYFTVLVFEKS